VIAATLAALPPAATLLIDPRRVTLGMRQVVPAGVEPEQPSVDHVR